MALSQPERLVMSKLGTKRGQQVDTKILHYTGHSPYSYLFGKDHGRSHKAYRPPMGLTTIGRKSGNLHTVALAYFPVDEGWAVVGSAHGSPSEPHWVRNLRANPAAWVRLDRATTPVHATVLEGEAKQPIWATITARAPIFDSFQQGVEREIPIVRLQPRSSARA